MSRFFKFTATPGHYWQEFWALRDINFTVASGETLGIIGPNGSGKSTLLQLICGTLWPTTGRTHVRGRVAALLELGSGFNPEFSGRENIYLYGTVLGLTRAQLDDKLDSMLAFADIGNFIDQPVKTYSTGMSMRLAFAVVAHVDADVLVIDEALAVGDAYFQQKCMRWLRNFRERGAILFCSHDIGAVLTLCQQAIWLDHGTMRAIGPAKEVCEAYNAGVYSWSQVPDGRRVQLSRSSAGKAQEPRRSGPMTQIIQVFEFNENSASFGTGNATIQGVRLVDADEKELSLLEGGEPVQIIVRAYAETPLESPIIGFYIKDRLGQPLFGDNTYFQYCQTPVRVPAGQTIEARFAFDMPLLQSGNYSVTAAIASGTLESHVQHHWLHDSLIFEVQSPYRKGVMIAIPMHSIKMHVAPPIGEGANVPTSGPA
jgi:lipopolysaccharide transport system ATP-binding protein